MTLCICIATVVCMIISIFTNAELRFKKLNFSLYWVFCVIGALAGIMWMNLSKRYKENVGFSTFFKYGLIISVPTLLATLAVM